jgi:hypothetical protein
MLQHWARLTGELPQSFVVLPTRDTPFNEPDGGFCVNPSSIRWEKIMGMKEEVDWEFVRNRALRQIIVEQIRMAHPPVSFK